MVLKDGTTSTLCLLLETDKKMIMSYGTTKESIA